MSPNSLLPSEDEEHTYEILLDRLLSEHKLAMKGQTDEEALMLLKELPGFDVTSLYAYKRLNQEDEEFHHVLTYVSNSQDYRFQIQVLDVIKIVRDADAEHNKNEFPQKRKKMRLMLWHGTKKEVIASILKEGFRRPNLNGQMFGNGIYFADRVSKSVRYCFHGNPPSDPPINSRPYLLLCDVLVGTAYITNKPHPEFTTVPKLQKTNPFDSVKCAGELTPEFGEQIEFDGAKWPLGKTVRNQQFRNYTFTYNEFIVYNPSSIKIKYVVKVHIV